MVRFRVPPHSRRLARLAIAATVLLAAVGATARPAAATAPDLEVTIGGAPGIVYPVVFRPDDFVVYDVTVRNIGTDGAKNIELLTTPLQTSPAGLPSRFSSADPRVRCAPAAELLRCQVTYLAPGDWVSLTVGFLWLGGSDEVVIKAVVDPHAVIPESNETNNSDIVRWPAMP